MTERRNITAVDILYKNHKGVVSWRTIIPIEMWFGSTPFHPKPQWLVKAIDVAKKEPRDFAWSDVRELRVPREDDNGHIIYRQKDYGIPASICDSYGDILLGLCKVCGAGEIELEKPCTGLLLKDFNPTSQTLQSLCNDLPDGGL